MKKTLAALAFLGCCVAQQAEAHPHAFIDLRTIVLVDDNGNLTGLKEHWIFDQFYTEFALHDFAYKKDGKLDHDKLLALAKENLHGLSDFSYFTYFQGHDNEMHTSLFKPVKTYDSYLEKKRIALDFTLEFEKPIPAKGQTVTIKIYDPSYYTAMLHEEDPKALQVEGGGGKCTATLDKPKPDAAWQELAAALDRNAKAPDNLGVYFAEKIVLTCKE